MAGQRPDRLQGIFIGNLDNFIIHLCIENRRDEARAGAHQLMRSRLPAGEHRRTLRLHDYDAEFRQPPAQHLSRTGNRSAGS
ncbi:hypothetical protein D3C86_1783090 [compost metagenome]